MKRVLCFLVLLVGVIYADDSVLLENHTTPLYRINSTNDITSPWVVTNSLTHPARVLNVTYRLPASVTSSFQVLLMNMREVNSYSAARITTNQFGEIETNAVTEVTNTVIRVSTNTWITWTTNVQNRILDDADIPDVYLRPGDWCEMSWPYTNVPNTGIVRDVSATWGR